MKKTRTTISVFVLLYSLFLLFQLCTASEVIQSIILTRHGDRTAFRILQNDPINWKNLTGVDVGGELTGLGMKQCYMLGSHLRSRYLNYSSPHYISGISDWYNKDDYLFKSSAENRCIQSSWSISMGLFPEKGLMDDTTGTEALPHKVRPIDIHSKDAKNDIEIRSTDYCPSIARVFASYRDYNPEYRKLEKKYKTFMERMHRLTGDDTAKTLDQFYWFADTVMTQHYHNALHLPQLKKNIKLIEELGSLSLLLRRGNRNLVGTMSGGPFISFILETMRQRISNESRKRFIHISGHDSTIIAVLTALRLIEDYPNRFFKKPSYASALVFELRKQASTGPEDPPKYYVQILYKDGLGGKFEPVALKSLGKRGCDAHCPYDTFVELALEDATIGNWCNACGNHDADICIQEHYKTQKRQSLLLMIASIALSVLLAASILILVISVLIKAYAHARNYSYDEIR